MFVQVPYSMHSSAVAIIGGGYAGLTLGAFLHLHQVPFVLIPGTKRCGVISKPDFGVGLWSPALRSVRELGLLSSLEQKGRYVGLSGYKDCEGNWLAQPSEMSSCIDNDPCLMFVPESEVLQAFQSLIPAECIIADVLFENFKEIHNGVAISLSDGSVLQAELLVAADGMWSSVRKQVHPTFPGPAYHGYKVIRGVSKETVSDISFQSWGLNARFAAVPLKQGQQWFATLASPDPSLENFSGSKESLQHFFSQWHAPIPEILASTSADNILVENAYYFPQLQMLGEQRCCFIGDSTHLIDPILAQGAGLAIEGAVILGKSIHKLRTSRMPLDVNSLFPESDFEMLHRLKKLAAVSKMSQAIGQMNSQALIQARNLSMKIIPNVFKCKVFDRVIKSTLS